MRKCSLKQLMLALCCMPCLTSVIWIKSAEQITEQKKAESSISTRSKRCMSAVFTEQENAKKIRQETRTVPRATRRTQARSSQRKSALRTATRSRLLPLQENAKKARQEIEALALGQETAPADVQQPGITHLKKQVEALSDMFRSVCLGWADKAQSDAQNGGELALTKTVLQSTILDTEKMRLALEQKNTELVEDLAVSRQVIVSMGLNAEASRAKTLSDDQTIEQLNREARANTQTINKTRKNVRNMINELRKIAGTEKIIERYEFKLRMDRETRLDKANQD